MNAPLPSSGLSPSARDRFTDLLRRRERWLVMRVIRAARRHGYAPLTPASADPWNESIRGLSVPLAGFLTLPASEWGPWEALPSRPDPLHSFAEREALRHRRRGLDLRRFLGLSIHFRWAYVDFVRRGGFAEPDRDALTRAVTAFFDHFQLAVASAWVALDENAAVLELRSSVRDLMQYYTLHSALLNSVSLPIFFVRDDGDIQPMSECARRLLEYLSGNAAGSSLPLLYDDEVATLGIPYPEGPREFEIKRFPVADVRSELVGALVILEDRTEMREVERHREMMARNLDRMRKMEAVATLAGGLAHEMNNLLQPIVGMVSAVRDGLPPGHRDADCLDVAIDAARRARDLVTGILKFSRRDDQGAVAMDVRDEAEAAVELLRGMLPEDVELRYRAPPVLPGILARPGLVHECLVNLGTNAIHALQGRSGRIDVALAPLAHDDPDFGERYGVGGEAGIVVTVADTGAGMEPAVLDRCLEPFFTTKAVGLGTGLGLPIVHGLVVSVGGSLAIESAPQRGTTIRLLLPSTPTSALELDDRR